MNSELFTLNLSDLENLLTKSNCSCHFINPNKTRIILWKEEKDGLITYYLRIGIQKFISYPLTDKNSELYWRFRVWEKEVAATELSQKEVPTELPTPPSELDPITKFHQRQAQTKNYDKANHSVEPSTNEPSH